MAGVVNPAAGTRTEPKDSYIFVRGGVATFKTTFQNENIPVTLDITPAPSATILQPAFLSLGSPFPVTIAVLPGTLVAGQQFEYKFDWTIPISTQPLDQYIISYSGYLGGQFYVWGDEYFTIVTQAGQVGVLSPSYATISDVRLQKFNIDDFLPLATKEDLTSRNNIIQYHLNNAATKLREELALFRQKGNTENYRLFCIYYTVYTILLGSRGENGSSVSDQNLQFWKSEWSAILAQEKRKGQAQGISLGRG